jgi:hypothetical protein
VRRAGTAAGTAIAPAGDKATTLEAAEQSFQIARIIFIVVDTASTVGYVHRGCEVDFII